jgi:ankyrin repeat protein
MISISTPLPYPYDWANIHKKMMELWRENRNRSIPEPLTPLILGGADDSTPSEIRQRWETHINWINKHGFYEEIKKILPTSSPDYDVAAKIAGIPEWWPGSEKEAINKLFDGAELDDIDEIKYALNYGISIEERNREGQTPLITASQFWSTESIKFLIDNGANINAESIEYESIDDYEGMTPLCAAIMGEDGHSPYVEKEKHETTLLLLKKGASVKTKCNFLASPLQLACSFGLFETVVALVKYGANVEWSSADKFSPYPLLEAVMGQKIEIVSFLLKNKANRLRVGPDGELPIHHACISGKFELLNLLLEYDSKAQINFQNEDGETPLHVAAENSQLTIYQFLLKKGADFNIKNHNGESALDIVNRIKLKK